MAGLLFWPIECLATPLEGDIKAATGTGTAVRVARVGGVAVVGDPAAAELAEVDLHAPRILFPPGSSSHNPATHTY